MEFQARYVVDAVRTLSQRGHRSVEVRAEVQEAFNREVDQRLEGTGWNTGNCHSYFIYSRGRNAFNYPGRARELGRRLRSFDPAAYVCRAAGETDQRGSSSILMANSSSE